ncbi:hypothetical protein Tco_0159145 [Tanacetum coccineum]
MADHSWIDSSKDKLNRFERLQFGTRSNDQKGKNFIALNGSGRISVITSWHNTHAAEVSPDQLCPPNKRYDLMDANKKVDLEHVQCPPESKILTNIIKNHPLRFSIAASSSVPWIYNGIDDFRQSFHLPQQIAENLEYLCEAVDVAIQLKSNKLREEAQAENQAFLNSLDSNMQKIIKDQVKTQTSKIKSKVEKYVTDSLGAKVLIRSTNQPQTSYRIASSLLELELKRILIDKMEENKSIDKSDVQKNLYNALVEAYNTDKDLISSYNDEAESSKEPTRKESRTTSSSKGASRSQPTNLNKTTHLEFITNDDDVNLAREVQDKRPWHPSTSTTPDREWHLTKTVSDLPPQHCIINLAQAAGTQSSFDEFMATPIDFSAFMINRLKIDHLTQELLTGPTYDLIKGTCKSIAELEYHLEEVFKATNEQLDWNNPEGTPYPHNLSKPLPLIPNTRGRLVIPFNHFINNDLEYLKGGSSSRKYTT